MSVSVCLYRCLKVLWHPNHIISAPSYTDICIPPVTTVFCHIIQKTSQNKNIEYKMYVFLYHFYPKHLILRRILPDSIHYVGLQVKFPLFLSDCNSTLIFSTDYRKILKYKIL